MVVQSVRACLLIGNYIVNICYIYHVNVRDFCVVDALHFNASLTSDMLNETALDPEERARSRPAEAFGIILLGSDQFDTMVIITNGLIDYFSYQACLPRRISKYPSLQRI